jgi:hypothetical protein
VRTLITLGFEPFTFRLDLLVHEYSLRILLLFAETTGSMVAGGRFNTLPDEVSRV